MNDPRRPDLQGPIIAAYSAMLDGKRIELAAEEYQVSVQAIRDHCDQLLGGHLFVGRKPCMFCGEDPQQVAQDR